MKLCYTLASGVLIGTVLCGCGSTPFSIGATFVGAGITVNFPEGIHPVAAQVAVDPQLTKPVLMVPQGSEISAKAESATVQKKNGEKLEVPIVEAPVQDPVLKVPPVYP